LYLDIRPTKATGKLRIEIPDIEPDEMRESCTLDVASRGGASREEIADLMNVTRERVRQIEILPLAQLRGKIERRPELMDHVAEVCGISR
jgi:hypothetical protein